MTPFYGHLPLTPGIGADIDRVGIAATGLVAAAFAVHGVTSYVKRASERQLPAEQSVPPPKGKGNGP
jgi:hypothetical protein